jgi:hypothetical protein
VLGLYLELRDFIWSKSDLFTARNSSGFSGINFLIVSTLRDSECVGICVVII